MNESSHWYAKDGTAVHEVPNKSKGGMRPTKLSDARKLGLYPSVTTVLKVLAATELDRWKQKQVLLASMTLPRGVNESDDDYMERIMEDAFEQVGDAADLGTRVHKAIEDHFQGRPYDKELSGYIESVEGWVQRNGVKFLSHEIRMVATDWGYAGTTDALIEVAGRDGVGVLDFKTRKSKPEYPMKPWSKEPMQIAAYGRIKAAKFGVNVFISTTEPGRIEEAWYEESAMREEAQAFYHVAMLWQHLNNYVPPK